MCVFWYLLGNFVILQIFDIKDEFVLFLIYGSMVIGLVTSIIGLVKIFQKGVIKKFE